MPETPEQRVRRQDPIEGPGLHAGPLSPDRVAKVDAAREEWIRKLVDLSRRNNILYFHDLKVGSDEGETLDFEPAFARLKEAARVVPGFGIKPRWVVGNFAFQKLAIVKDLRELAEALARNNIIAGIAGDDAARASARGGGAGLDPFDIDRTPPDNEFLILDADSSQQQAIRASLQGQNGVISGPPGTGPAQAATTGGARLAVLPNLVHGLVFATRGGDPACDEGVRHGAASSRRRG